MNLILLSSYLIHPILRCCLWQCETSSIVLFAMTMTYNIGHGFMLASVSAQTKQPA
jgi:hypothetical protein